MKKESFRIATFNIGDFTGLGFAPGSEEGKTAIRATMAGVRADLWALQEDVGYYCKETKEDPYTAVYGAWKNYARRSRGDYNYKAFLSDLPISDVEEISFAGDMIFRHTFFLHATVNLGGHEVHLYNLHLDWSDKVVREEQTRQVLAAAANKEYCIIIGDMNPDDYINNGERVSGRCTMADELPRFTGAGYIPANMGEFGTFATILDDEGVRPCDHIFITKNMRFLAVDRVADPWMNDHAILWADIAFA